MLLRLAALLSVICTPFLLVGGDCSALRSQKLDHTTITRAESVPADATATEDGVPLAKLPAFCRVSGVIQPSSDSHINFEVWLPAEDWNQRFLGVGNGGFAGAIDYRVLGGNLKRGFATAATDTGHQGEAVDASWAFHHPEQIADFGYRALHLTVENAKALLTAFYGKPQQHAYFDSCSNGGREALMEAQRFPNDFDGILAGAPAYAFTHTLASGIEISQALFADPKDYISAVKIPAIHRAVLQACDASDGVKDGIIDDPAKCKFDPGVLQCQGTESKECLTAAQVTSLKKLYGMQVAGPVSSGSAEAYIGKAGHVGFVPGAEEGANGWRSWVLGDAPGLSSGAGFVQSFFRYMAYSDPAWNLLKANAVQAQKTSAPLAKPIDAANPDLAAFFQRGGKLILYHGWNDPALSPWATVDYFRQAQTIAGSDAAAKSMRLYMVPGMQHCVGGPGATFFGQLGLPTSGAESFGVFTALQHWVEDGTVPGEITATKWEDDNPGKTVQLTRPLCAYPAVPEYSGSGDTTSAKNFHCSTD